MTAKDGKPVGGRPREPDPRRERVIVLLSQKELAVLDRAAGKERVSGWIRQLALDAAKAKK